jgi:hypothetical protein
MSTEHSLKGEINISKTYIFLSFCCAVVLANNILVLNLSLVVCFYRKLQKCHEVVVYVIIFSLKLNDSDIRYNLLENVENILYSHYDCITEIPQGCKIKRTGIHANVTDT